MTSDALKIIDHHVIGEDAKLREEIRSAEVDIEIGQLIHDARTAAGLTQAELADRIGTNQSVISRLEDADYEGHSVAMLHRIAEALNRRLEIRFSTAFDAQSA